MSDGTINETFSKPRERVEESAEGYLRLVSPAKLNLNLLVGPVRKDGYHPLDSYVAKVTLYDQITLRRREDSEINLNIGGVYFGGKIRNTVYIAAKIMAERYEGHGVDIDLFKVVPPSTGLGSPSSNAATVLWGLNKIWALGLSNDEIIEIGILLGSDVAMFLGPPASRMTGRGEFIEPVDVHPFWAVLCIPEFSCKTAEVYQLYDFSGGEMLDQFDSAVLAKPCSQWRDMLHNQLATAAEGVTPQLAKLREKIARSISQPVRLTGSGSGMFVLCETREEAEEVLNKLDDDIRKNCVVVQNNPW